VGGGQVRGAGAGQDPLPSPPLGARSGNLAAFRGAKPGPLSGMRRLFISHRNGEDENVALVRAINAHFSQLGFDVFVDFERLQPGATWRNEIYTWLGVCHAAVVVLSPATLAEDSVWVPRECSILAWRKALDPKFPVIPVLLPGLGADELRADLRFRDLGFHELQSVIIHEDELSTCTAVARIAQTLARDPTSPFEELAGQVAVQLESIGLDSVQQALLRAGAPGVAAIQGLEPRRSAALALLDLPLARAQQALEYLASRANDPAAIDRVLDIIAPSWVDPVAAAWITHCAFSVRPRPAAVVNAATRFAAEMYVRRATCRPPKTMWRLVAVTAVLGEFAVEDAVREIERTLFEEFRSILQPDPFEANDEPRLVPLLDELSARGTPVVVVLRLPAVAADLMAELQARFPALLFLFLAGEALPEEAACPVGLLRRVEPALAPGREKSARNEYDAARAALRLGV